MVAHDELVAARDALLERIVDFFTQQPDVTGILLSGSIPAGTSDAYSDIDLRVVATTEGQTRLLAGRFEWPRQWGDWLFNEWRHGTSHLVSHFQPFLKVDVFYLSPETFQPSPWLKLPGKVYLDRDGIVQRVLEASKALPFPRPDPSEVSRYMSKVLAASHETVRRARRGELIYAQTLLEELRFFVKQLDIWLFLPDSPEPAFKMERRLSAPLYGALRRSYVVLEPVAIEKAAVELTTWFVEHLPALHQVFSPDRSLLNDQEAAATVIGSAPTED